MQMEWGSNCSQKPEMILNHLSSKKQLTIMTIPRLTDWKLANQVATTTGPKRWISIGYGLKIQYSRLQIGMELLFYNSTV